METAIKKTAILGFVFSARFFRSGSIYPNRFRILLQTWWGFCSPYPQDFWCHSTQTCIHGSYAFNWSVLGVFEIFHFAALSTPKTKRVWGAISPPRSEITEMHSLGIWSYSGRILHYIRSIFCNNNCLSILEIFSNKRQSSTKTTVVLVDDCLHYVLCYTTPNVRIGLKNLG